MEAERQDVDVLVIGSGAAGLAPIAKPPFYAAEISFTVGRVAGETAAEFAGRVA